MTTTAPPARIPCPACDTRCTFCHDRCLCGGSGYLTASDASAVAGYLAAAEADAARWRCVLASLAPEPADKTR